MRPVLKVTVVLAGYALAFLLASAAVAARVAHTSAADEQGSPGMYAFGDSLIFIGVFGVCALVPTAAALLFLRSNRPFWIGLSVLVLLVAVTSPTAAVLYLLGRHAPPSALLTAAELSVVRILLAPVLSLTFLVCACLAPHRRARVALLAGTLMELVACACGGFAWFIPVFWHRR